MKKIVYESLQEFSRANSVNEGLVDDAWGKAKSAFSAIKGAIVSGFQKIGNFFIGMTGGEPVKGVLPPINVGVMLKNKSNKMSKFLTYMPNAEDKAIDPSIPSVTPEQLDNKRTFVKKGKDKEPSADEKAKILAARLRALGTDKGMNEALRILDRKKREYKKLFEAQVPLGHPHAKVINVNTERLAFRIKVAMKKGPKSRLIIWGAPGIGKTQIVKSILQNSPGTRLIDVQTAQMSPDDWQMPAVKEIREGWWVALDVPKDWLPVYKPTGDPKEDAIRNNIANMGNETTEGQGGILFFDEFSRASAAVQNSCLKIIDERMVAGNLLGDKWVIIAAANRDVDDPETSITFGNALSNRMTHLNFIPSFDSWKSWAHGKIDQRILDYLELNRPKSEDEGGEWFNLDDAEAAGLPFASPRSWHVASDEIAATMEVLRDEGISKASRMDLMEAIGSAIGKAGAEKVVAFILLLEQFTVEEIRAIFKDPSKVKTPKKAGSGFSVADAHALISAAILSTQYQELTPLEFENFVSYLVLLDNSSLASAAIKTIFRYHPYMHAELGEGETKGKDKFKKGFDMYIDKYRNSF